MFKILFPTFGFLQIRKAKLCKVKGSPEVGVDNSIKFFQLCIHDVTKHEHPGVVYLTQRVQLII